MVAILVLVVALVAWSLHLIEAAISRKEFSLILAGFLVASAATALMGVYFLAGTCVTQVSEMAQHSYSSLPDSDSLSWLIAAN
jgi:hypothetical protein